VVEHEREGPPCGGLVGVRYLRGPHQQSTPWWCIRVGVLSGGVRGGLVCGLPPWVVYDQRVR
jgi:hypothetical protein